MQGRPQQKRYFYIIAFFSTKYNQKNTGILCRTFVRFYQKSGCKMPVFHRETKRDLFYLDDLVLDLSAGGDGDLDCLAGIVPEQRLADR